jgi:acid stress chaperone HdeB
MRSCREERATMPLRRVVRLAVHLVVGLAAALFAGSEAAAAPNDYAKIACRDFLASGQPNMAVIIWWLRGYHAGKTGSVVFDPTDPYAKRLGYYCRNHPLANLIETSERIFSELDHGI